MCPLTESSVDCECAMIIVPARPTTLLVKFSSQTDAIGSETETELCERS